MRLGDLPANTATFICTHVFDKARDVGFVCLDFDGDLSMLCADSHDWDVERVHVVGVGHVLGRHPELQDIRLERGCEAEKIADGWRVSKMKEDQE